MMKIITNEKETYQLAKELLPAFKKRKIILLYGDLGSGKTTFTQCLGKLLNIKKYIKSPTYNIMKRYLINEDELTNSQLKYLIHIDAYRLNGGGEEFLEYMFDNLTVIEWAGNLEVKFPNAIRIDIEVNDKNQRIFNICSCAH